MPAPNTITPAQLMRLIGTPDCPTLIDVCIDADFAEDPRLIPTSRHHAHDDIATLAAQLKDQRVIVICQKGKKLSQGAAAIVRSEGVIAQVLEGGIHAWRDASGALIAAQQLPAPGSYWVTRQRPKVDRIACPWLIRRFIDPIAKILYVPAPDVMAVADKFDAIPFDVDGADLSHSDGLCSFDALLSHFDLKLPALHAMAQVIRAADGTPGAKSDQASGLLALSVGLSRMYKNDVEQLEAAMPLYDALFRWARDGQGETHSWEAH